MREPWVLLSATDHDYFHPVLDHLSPNSHYTSSAFQTGIHHRQLSKAIPVASRLSDKMNMVTGVLAFLVTLGAINPFSVSALHHLGHGSRRMSPDVACPSSIEITGDNPSNWTVIHHLDQFLACSRKLKLLDFPINIPVADPNTDTYIRTCTSVRGSRLSLVNASWVDSPTFAHKLEINLQVTSTPASSKTIPHQVVAAARELLMYLLSESQPRLEGQPTVLFAHYGQSTVGIYVGDRVGKFAAAYGVLAKFINHVLQEGMPETFALQYCGEYVTEKTAVGVVADASGGAKSLAAVQGAVQAWAGARCVENLGEARQFGNATLWFHAADRLTPNAGTNSTSLWNGTVNGNETSSVVLKRTSLSRFVPRADCRTVSVMAGDDCGKLAARCQTSGDTFMQYNQNTQNLCSTLMPGQLVCCSRGSIPTPRANADGTCADIQVREGDGCGSLASRCAIPPSDITKYNTDSNFCSTLQPGQYVCCSPGPMRDRTPKPNADGTCATYTVQKMDGCAKIASNHGIKDWHKLEDFNNKKTWAWAGCDRLMPDMIICVSTGDPPMPTQVEGLRCGPQVPGTQRPPKGTSLADLNPCPLKACCSIWGFCGTTSEFCTKSDVNGNPGTAKVGENGCISNCGTDIINNKNGPSKFINIAYFEAWNFDRPCLWLDVTRINKQQFTHIHFAFLRITESFTISVPPSMKQQFDRFTQMDGIKRIASFGGWEDSTSPATYWIFREGVNSRNRVVLAQNLANFVKQHNLDGVDIDWEYPGAPDIPNIPPGNPNEGKDYLTFLQLLRRLLPSDKSLSIAAPASFWYLQNFPIEEMASILDYIVYMTYDLHGRWDYGSKYSVPGCPNGDCLRSHVNMTETMNTLSMITKAGVPSAKVIVGVSSYGRAFRMVQPGCHGPMCKYIGPVSQAKKGLCTGESGYISNAELSRVMEEEGRVQQRFVDDSMSNILVYDDVEWVAYMDDANKKSRTLLYKAWNFGGVTDWAVDLARFTEDEAFSPDAYSSMAKMMQDTGVANCPWKRTDGFTCLDKASTRTAFVSGKRWKETNADCSWHELRRRWIREMADYDTFTDFVWDFYDDAEAHSACEHIDGCSGAAPQCQETLDSGPAGVLVLTSLIDLNKRFSILYNSFKDAYNQLEGEKENFVKIFSPPRPEDDPRTFNLGIDMLGIIFSVVSAPMFNSFLPRITGKKNGEGADNTKDMTYNLASWVGSYLKDERIYPSVQDRIIQISSALGESTYILVDSIEKVNADLFNGEPITLNVLTGAIAGGRLAKGGRDGPPEQQGAPDMPGLPEMTILAKKVLVGMMLPIAWRLASYHPFLIDTGKGCDEVGSLDFEYIDSETSDKTRICYYNQLFYFVSPDFEYKDKVERLCQGPEGGFHSGGGSNCLDIGGTFDRFVALPGTDEILSETRDWRITLEEIARGSLATWQNNGRVNGGKKFDPADLNDLVRLAIDSSDLTNLEAPGIFMIPVCHAKDALDNWKKSSEDGGNAYWPCNGP